MSTYDQDNYKIDDTKTGEEDKIDLFALLDEFFAGLRVMWPLWILIMILAAGFGYMRSVRTYSPVYQVQATFTVETDYGSSSYDYYNNAAASQMATVFPYLLTSTPLNELVAEELKLSYVPGSISATVMENTNLFKLTVTSSDAQMAYDILNAVIKKYPEVADKVIGKTVLQMVSEAVVPEKPMVVLNPAKAAVKWAAIGFIIGAVLVFVYGATRNTVRGENSLKRFTNQKCLGEIMRVRQKRYLRMKRKYLLVTDKKADYGFRESFRMIVSRLEREMKKKQDKVLMVTSALQGEGKTTVTMNLAFSMAEAGQKKVILLDCDLRKPATTEALLGQKKPEYTVYDVLQGSCSLEEALVLIGESGVWLLPGDSRTFENASELAGSKQMEKLFQDAKAFADFVIVDTSPADMMADAFSIGQLVDGILMVVRYQYAKRTYVLNAMRQMNNTEARLYGYVINASGVRISDKLSGYHYGYGYRYGHGSYHRRNGYGYGYGYGYGQEKSKHTK